MTGAPLSGASGNPTISVVIPAYNAAAFVEATLDGVRAQTLSPLEVIVTDDGSTDGTEAVLIAYAARHPTFPLTIIRQPNGKIASARNRGVEKATGDFVAFLDADDGWYPEKIQKLSEFLANHPEVDVVYHEENHVDGKGASKRVASRALVEPVFEDLLLNGNALSTSATTVRRRRLTEAKGFDPNPDFNSAEDYDLWLRLARRGARFAVLPETLGEYLVAGQGVTARIEYHQTNILNVLLRQLDELDRANAMAPIRTQALRDRFEFECKTRIGLEAYAAGDVVAARRWFISSLRHRPLAWRNYARIAKTLGRVLNLADRPIS